MLTDTQAGSHPEQPEETPFHSAEGQKLHVDFSWRKFYTPISDATTGSPLFKVKYSPSKPQLKFITAADDLVLGNGTLNEFSINAECELQGREVNIKALNHFKSRYTYLSRAFAADPASPIAMTSIGDRGVKDLDLVCLNYKQEAVARLDANIWAMKRIATIEFAQGIFIPQAAKEDIVVTGMIVFYVLAARSASLRHVIGALFAKPGPIKQHDQTALKSPVDRDARSL